LNTNLRRLLTLITFLLALVGLAFNPNPAQAQESATTIPAPAVDTTPPSTYFVVVGAQEYKNAPGLTGTEGGEYDCKVIVDHLHKQGFGDRHVMSACGPELVRDGFFMRLDRFMMDVTTGSTVFVVWIGHGGTDPVTGYRVFAAVDGSFDLLPWENSDVAISSYSMSGVSPGLLYGAMQRIIPADTRVVFVTDVARGGTYQASRGTILLEGPSAKDFQDMPGAYALSPTPGKSVPVGLTRQTLMHCIARPLWSVVLSARQMLECYADVMTKGGVTVEMAGTWKADDSLVFFPPLAVSPAPSKKPIAKIVLISGGAMVTVVGTTGAIVTFTEARSLGEDIAAGNYGVAGDPALTVAVERYNQSAAVLPVWYTATGVGAALTVTGITLPMPHNVPVSAKLSVVPGGMMVAGHF
jgi:hypothetical protein